MRSLLVCALFALGIQQYDASLVLDSAKLSGEIGEGRSFLRDGGDLYNPHIPGLNILYCGGFGNDSPLDTRLKASRGDTLSVVSTFGNGHPGGDLCFELTYGQNPNMQLNPGYQLVENCQPIAAAEKEATTSLTLSSLLFKGLGTVQVTFIPTGSLIDESGFKQCIDLEITDGATQTVAPGGSGDPDYKPRSSPEIVQVLAINPDDGGDIETVHIILFIIVGILLICFIITCIKYKSPQQQQQQPQFAPMLAMAENVQDPAAPVKVEEVSAPVKEVSSDNDKSLDDQKDEPPPQEEPEEIIREPVVDNGDGSKGRHFHFRYLDDA